MTAVSYIEGALLEDLAVTWQASDGSVIDFATGHTFVVKVGPEGGAAVFEKTTGITPAATAPNVVIAWAAGELDLLAGDRDYVVEITAIRTIDSKPRIMHTSMHVAAALA